MKRYYAKNKNRLLTAFLVSLLFLVAGSSSALPLKNDDQHTPSINQSKSTPKIDIPKSIWSAKQFLKAGKYRDAAKICETILRTDENQFEARSCLAVAYKMLGDENKYRKEAETVSNAAPGSAYLFLIMAQTYQAGKDFKNAEKYYQQGIKISRSKTELQLGLAGLYAKQGNFAKAKPLYNKALTNKNISAAQLLNANFALCRIALREKKYDNVINRAEKTIKLFPPIPQSYQFAATAYLAKGEDNNAIKTYSALAKANPETPIPYQELALIYCDRLNNYQKAIEYARKAVERSPDNAKSQDISGWVYYNNKEFNKALEKFLSASKLAPKTPQYLYHVGLAYLKSGKKSEAARTFRKAISLLPAGTEKDFRNELEKQIKECGQKI